MIPPWLLHDSPTLCFAPLCHFYLCFFVFWVVRQGSLDKSHRNHKYTICSIWLDPDILLARSHPHHQAFHRENASRYSHRGEDCLVKRGHDMQKERVHRVCLLVPWWQAAQRCYGTTRRACLESLLSGGNQRPTHQARDARLVVLNSMPDKGQARKELACLHHFICFQCSCFLQLLIDAVLLHCMMCIVWDSPPLTGSSLIQAFVNFIKSVCVSHDSVAKQRLL